MFIVAQICRSWGETPPNEGAFLSDTISHLKSPPALLVSQIAAFSVWIISWFVHWLCYSSLWESSKKTQKEKPKMGQSAFCVAVQFSILSLSRRRWLSDQSFIILLLSLPYTEFIQGAYRTHFEFYNLFRSFSEIHSSSYQSLIRSPYLSLSLSHTKDAIAFLKIRCCKKHYFAVLLFEGIFFLA